MMTSTMHAPSGVTQPTAAKTGWWGKLRVPVLIVSVLFLLFSTASYVLVPVLQLAEILPSPLTELFVRHDASPRRAAEVAYAARLRMDADRLIGLGDDEGALVRLDQAAKHDPEGDQRAEIQRTRQELRARLGEATDLDHTTHGGL